MDLIVYSDDRPEEASSNKKALPPRPVHKRSSSGKMNNILANLTPPVVASRKRAPSLEDEREEFHNKGQQFLQSMQHKRPTLYSSPQPRSRNQSSHCSFLDSPTSGRRGSSLQSIGDDDENDDDDDDDDDERSGDNGTIDNQDLPPSLKRVELQGMHVLDDADHLDASLVYVDNSNDEPFREEAYRQRHLRFELGAERSCDRQRQRDADSKLSDFRIPSAADVTVRERQQSIREYAIELEKERESLIKQWRAEFEAEMAEVAARKSTEKRLVFDNHLKVCRQSIYNALSTLEVFICNMPLTIAASALSWATLGVVWYKFGAEHLIMHGICQSVHFHSPRNSYPHEFPGSFSCDDTPIYHAILYFHFLCHIFAAILASFFLLKVCLAWQVVVDDLTNPVTATPVGVICITLEILFAAAGEAGDVAVMVVAIFHTLFALWYLYVAVVRFKLLPDPSWFPGTVGLAYASVKAWIVCNVAGKLFLGLCLSFFFGLFFVSVIRVALNKKIAAPVCWMQLSAPSIALYASTIMTQPTASQEWVIAASAGAHQVYLEHMHTYYLPFQHAMFAFCLLGMASSLHSLWARWDTLKHKPFSPAHLAFGFPTLSHANAVQAYRSSINSFSTIPSSSHFHIILYSYWITVLVVGSIANLILTYKAMIRLPEWTNINIAGEDEPPNPSETIMYEMLHDAHEVLDQPFVSPAVLQANETGTLIRVRRGTEDYLRHGPYIRTRHVTSLGFDPTLSLDELRVERARLFDWVAKNAPRTRNRTLSIPLFLHLRDKTGRGIYGTFDGDQPQGTQRHRRVQTMGDIK